MKFLLVCGLAGSGKTELLRALGQAGEQVLDLEMLAHHRGSAFGGMGQAAQPSHRDFTASVLAAVAAADPARPIWVEDEGDYIGSVGVPPSVLAAMRTAARIELVCNDSDRQQRILADYGASPLGDWIAALERVAPRLGAGLATKVRTALLAGDRLAAVTLLLGYYDRTYAHRSQPPTGPLLGVFGPSPDPSARTAPEELAAAARALSTPPPHQLQPYDDR